MRQPANAAPTRLWESRYFLAQAVARHAGMVAHALPGFEHHLPRLVRHKGLRKRSADPRFRWQDRAADLA